MTMLSLKDITYLIPHATIHGDPSIVYERVLIDSRIVGPGDLFVALKGKNFDAHDFLYEAASRGVAAALVCNTPPARLPITTVEVIDTLSALGALARDWRMRFSLPVVVVAGSNGKTTVKEMISSIFKVMVGDNARLATVDNFNNQIGLPLTLLRLNDAHRLAVIELGTSYPGETEILSSIAAPTISLINNAQREHQEFMVTVEAVALEHASLIHALPKEGTAVFPADDPYSGIWYVAATGNRIIDFALQNDAKKINAQVTGRIIDGMLAIDTLAGSIVVRLSVLGIHNARNALAATSVALAANVTLSSIKAGLEMFEPIKKRLYLKRANVNGLQEVTIIDDTYNANPDSMRAAIDVLAAQPSPRVLIMGDMGESGEESLSFHREIGEYAYEQGIDMLYAIGPMSIEACFAYGESAQHFLNSNMLINALVSAGYPVGTTVLVKGSRHMNMDNIVDALTN
ncbi:MAG: UDP-N-acetylmuramoyl-tripeptide--D-alanyl-D-alanine ligase [Burkholderia sp.]|nr:UDP-N-acetylmuramoyl-tripeptide--D-alanyl-D-alanine ligase [Burkholderia sp.]